jgi:two-component system C4-dicarboxylate transport sensor histidine kinase DctB
MLGPAMRIDTLTAARCDGDVRIDPSNAEVQAFHSAGPGVVVRRLVLAAGFLAALAAVTALTHEIAGRMAVTALRESMAHRQDLYVANVEDELRRFEYLPRVVGADPRVLRLLREPARAGAAQAVNLHLQLVGELAGASAIYVMDREGLTLAASNWNQPTSFVNGRFAYRPYFQDAMKGLTGRFYGVGTVSREPGYYFANAVRDDDGRIAGVVAVKLSLDKLDRAWSHAGEQIVVADGNGVVFLASQPGWKYKTLGNLPSETLGRLAATRQYWKAAPLVPLGFVKRSTLDEHTAIVDVSPDPPAAGTSLGRGEYMVHGTGIRGTDWQLLMLADMAPAEATARLGAALGALTVILLGTLALYGLQRRRAARHARAARAALQRANDELERKVHARTEALSVANRSLQNEVQERVRAEEALRAAMQDLVQTAKMAALGKMSASVTHELNQPLAAMQTLAENAIKLLERDSIGEAKTNLRMIARTAAKMGRITSQLKKFTRRSDMEVVPVQVDGVLSDAFFLMKQTLRGRNIHLQRSGTGRTAWAVCDANRLEQVFVNLLSNAADALQGVDHPAIEVVVRQDDEHVIVEVHDNGPGIDDDATRHLFDPFFTTKDQGIGLGLAISSDIVRHFDGRLQASRSARLGGALFIVQLRLAPQHEAIG